MLVLYYVERKGFNLNRITTQLRMPKRNRQTTETQPILTHTGEKKEYLLPLSFQSLEDSNNGERQGFEEHTVKAMLVPMGTTGFRGISQRSFSS